MKKESEMDKEILDIIYSKRLLPHNLRVQSLQLLKGGMTNKNYLCSTEAGYRYVIRIPGLNTSWFIDRQSEWANHHRIAPLNINIEHVTYLKDSWIKASVFVENSFDTLKSRREMINIACEALRVLHHSNVTFSNAFWVVDKINLYESVVKQNEIKLSSKYKPFRSLLEKYYDKYLYSKIRWTACHNDLVKENILLSPDNKIYLIDWEYSGMNDPLWDIASFILENDLNIVEQRYLMAAYYRGSVLRSDALEMLALFKIYQDVLWYLWSKIKEFNGDNYAEYADKRLQRAIANYLNISQSVLVGEMQ